MGRNKDIQCRLHLEVREQADACLGCARVRLQYSREPIIISCTIFPAEYSRRLHIFLKIQVPFQRSRVLPTSYQA